MIPVINYTMTPPQGDPLAENIFNALKNAADYQSKNLQNKISQVDLKYAPQKAQSDINKTNAATNFLNTQQKYYGPNIESEMALRNAQTQGTQLSNQYYGPNIESEINLRNAQTNSTNVGTQYKPLEVTGNLLKNQSSGLQALASYMKSLDEPTKAAIVQQNPKSFAYIANQALDTVMHPQNALSSILGINPTQAQNLVGPGIAQNVKIPNQSGQDQNIGQVLINKLPNPLPLSPAQQKMGQDILSSSGATPQYNPSDSQADDIQKGEELARTKSVVSPEIWNQYSAAKQVSEMFNDQGIRKTIIGASRYANSIVGKSAELINAITKKNPESYQDYLDFKNNASTYILNRIRGLDAMGKTDSQREELSKMISSLNNVKSNPQQFLIQMDRLGKTSDSVAKAVEKSANPFGYKHLKLPDYNPILDSNNNIKEHPNNGNASAPNNDEISATARKYGISEAEVRRKLGI